MKKRFSVMALALLAAGMILTGCVNSDTKVDNIDRKEIAKDEEVDDNTGGGENPSEQLENSEVKDEESALPQEEPTAEQEEKNKTDNSLWKEAYREILMASQSNSDYRFALEYIDEDDIPELLISTGTYNGAGVDVYTYYNGAASKINEYVYGESGSFTFAEKQNLIRDEKTNKGYFSFKFYSITDGKENLRVSFFNNEAAVGSDSPDCVYKMNDEAVTIQVYQENLNNINESNRFKTMGCDEFMSITDENISVLDKFTVEEIN